MKYYIYGSQTMHGGAAAPVGTRSSLVATAGTGGAVRKWNTVPNPAAAPGAVNAGSLYTYHLTFGSAPLAAQILVLSSLGITYGQGQVGSNGGNPNQAPTGSTSFGITGGAASNCYFGYYAYVFRPSTGANVGVLWHNGSDQPAFDSQDYMADTFYRQFRQFSAGASAGPVVCADGDHIIIEIWGHRPSMTGAGNSFTYGGGTDYPGVNLRQDWHVASPTNGDQPATYIDIESAIYPSIYLLGETVPEPAGGLPANFLAAIASRDFKLMRWLEVEGIPYGYGTWDHKSVTEQSSQAGAFFAARDAAEQLLGIRSALTKVPPIQGQELDTLEGAPSHAGQIDVHILDVDDQPTLWAGAGNVSGAYLSADLTAAATSFVYTGDGSAIGSTGTLYIGNETVTFTGHNTGTKTITGLTRGLYRSTASAFGAGFPIGVAPYTMKGRRCWYYMIAILFTDSTFSDDEEDKVLRFSGRISGYKMGDSPAEYVVRLESLERELSKECFRELRQVADSFQAGIADGFGEGGTLSIPGTPGYTSDILRSTDLNAGWENGAGISETFALRIDDEILGCQIVEESRGLLQITARGLCGTKIAAHAPGFVGREVVIVAAGDETTGVSRDLLFAKFASVPTAGSPVAPDNPLIILLQLLLSTGLGTNEEGGSARNYDVLPASYGLGLDVDRVDVDSLEALASKTGTIHMGGVVEEAVNFYDVVKSLLAPLGLYATSLLDGRFAVRELRPLLPDETARDVDSSNMIRRARSPGWDANLSGVVQTIEWQHAWDLRAKRFRRITIHNISEAAVYSAGEGRRISYAQKLLYSGSDGVPGEPARMTRMDPASLLRRRGDFYRQRYARPPPVITVTVDYSFIDIELGELVSLTTANLPNPLLGLRGLVSALAEVTGKRIDEAEKTIELTVLLAGYQVENYRFIAPSLEIASAPTTSSFYCTPNAFTDPVTWQNDLRVYDADGDLQPTFIAGQSVRIYAADFSAYVVATILSIDLNLQKVTLTGVPATALAAGQLVTYDTYANSGVSDFRAMYAFLAAADGTLSAGTVDGHRYFP